MGYINTPYLYVETMHRNFQKYVTHVLNNFTYNNVVIASFQPCTMPNL